jgi:hypothetical protein
MLKYELTYRSGRVQRLEVKQTWLDEVECVGIIDARTLASRCRSRAGINTPR